MSTEKHTPGPWTYEPTAGAYKVTMSGSIRSFVVPGYGMNHSQVNAKRIVDCVNAMEGIDNPKKFRENLEAVKHLELDKYHNLKEVIQNMVDRLDEGGEMTLTKDSIIVHYLKEAIK